ncbi:DNA polymerase IV [Marivirga harenae]|uniref:DNA polymerase Y family protein n=1 Tax=Marivirga harenae TaxID=2010992 RepID=UPI0026E0BD9B|nr:DNA polymerase IV [Marivirga harenae]WKV11520.1 DNA polymerase IV [Marivirga harenae]|tara:strand:+ start:33138 stop:34277 length:1140 start_codon:yes stop_codon:yes gene_type:complete
MRQIAHIDLDSFFINCTLLKFPDLRGRPLIIGGLNNRGIVASASFEAKKYGVHKSMPTRVALQRCPDAVLLKGDFDLFTKYSDIVNEIMTERTPLHERAGIDEFYLDMTGMDRFHNTSKFTKELVNTIKSETGLPLLYGLSVNKTVAKICTSHARPIGGFEVLDNYVQPFLDPHSIRQLPAVGSKTFKLLRRIRIKFIKHIRSLPPEAMNELLGKTGIGIWKKANGIDPTPVVPYSSEKSIGKDFTFDQDTQDLKILKGTLLKLIEFLGFKLRKLNQMCACVSVRIRYSNHDTETMQKKIPYCANDEILMDVAFELFKKLYHRRMLIRLIGVKFSHLVQGSHQINLFTDNVKTIELYQAMDKLKNRYDNPAIVHRALSL